MSWLIPLGFIGFSGLAVLLLIYLIKPNFQNKYISSTFVWKLSLKQKRRRNPISKIKNLLILLCQILIISFCTFILAKPVFAEHAAEEYNEEIIIIDASASMRATGSDGLTRFERAVDEARAIAAETFDANGAVSVVLADNDPKTICNGALASDRAEVDEKLAALAKDLAACTYGSADIDKAMSVAGDIAGGRTSVHTVLITGKEYRSHGSVEIRDVSLSDGSEWNVAVVDVRADLNKNNAYVINVDLACYGRDVEVDLKLSLNNVNLSSTAEDGAASQANEKTYTLKNMPNDLYTPIRLYGNRITTVSIDTELIPDDNATVAADGSLVATPVFSFSSAVAFVQADDSLPEDNKFTLYGKNKQIIRIQYASKRPNSFFSAAFASLISVLRNRWSVNVREVRADIEEPAMLGYDLYVFEEYELNELPQDGVVFLVNPVSTPRDLGFTITNAVSVPNGVTPTLGDVHEITAGLSFTDVLVTRFCPISLFGDGMGFSKLLVYNNLPILISKNTETTKLMVMSFSVNYSTVTMNVDFPRMILNAVNYYIPTTFQKSVYNINEEVVFTPRSSQITIAKEGDANNKTVVSEFPATFSYTSAGSYQVTQIPISGKKAEEWFFVRIPAQESNIELVVDVLGNQFSPQIVVLNIEDLCVYFAAALVFLLVVERLLYVRTVG